MVNDGVYACLYDLLVLVISMNEMWGGRTDFGHANSNTVLDVLGAGAGDAENAGCRGFERRRWVWAVEVECRALRVVCKILFT